MILKFQVYSLFSFSHMYVYLFELKLPNWIMKALFLFTGSYSICNHKMTLKMNLLVYT